MGGDHVGDSGRIQGVGMGGYLVEEKLNSFLFFFFLC